MEHKKNKKRVNSSIKIQITLDKELLEAIQKYKSAIFGQKDTEIIRNILRDWLKGKNEK